MIVLDVETTGVDANKHSIIDIGAVEFENPNNRFYVQCRPWSGAEVSQQAMLINGRAESLYDMSLLSLEQAVTEFAEWSKIPKDRTLAGHNVGTFDIAFLKRAYDAANRQWDFGHRSFDLHSIALAHMIKRNVPVTLHNQVSGLDSATVHRYAGIPPEPTPHQGINGAKWEAESMHRILKGAYLLDEFKRHHIPSYLVR